MHPNRIVKHRVRKTVRFGGTQHRLPALWLGGVYGTLFGPVGFIAGAAVGYFLGQSANEEIAMEQLPDDDMDALGEDCLRQGDRKVQITLEKDGCEGLSPLGALLLGDRVSKTVTWERED